MKDVTKNGSISGTNNNNRFTPPHSPLQSPPAVKREGMKRESIRKEIFPATPVVLKKVKKSEGKIVDRTKLRYKLRQIAPLRFWVTIALLVLILVLVLLYVVRKEMKIYEMTVEMMGDGWKNRDPKSSPPPLSKKSIVMRTIATIFISGATSYIVKLVLSIIREPHRASWLTRMLPDKWRYGVPKPNLRGHEVVLYALNFVLVYQSIKVWKNWDSSPVSAMIKQWNHSRLNRFINYVNAKKAARLAAKAAKSSNSWGWTGFNTFRSGGGVAAGGARGGHNLFRFFGLSKGAKAAVDVNAMAR